MAVLKTQRLGGAAILMKSAEVIYLSGDEISRIKPLEPFNDTVCEFFAELSKRLQKDREALNYPDVLSFAFYCRKGNIAKIKQQLNIQELCIGKGLIFHIAPSNVPVNFAFTYLFGMLAGNANVVRVSTKDFPQVKIICRVMNELFQNEKYDIIKEHTAIIQYVHNKEVTDFFSSKADIRVIWGGDSTINEIRKSPIPSRCTEVTFADRYSFGIFDVNTILNESEEDLKKIADGFYNDTYLMDQNACSTPHMIFWRSNGSTADFLKVQERFWKAVNSSAKKYDLADIKVSDKYVALCKAAIDLKADFEVTTYDNLLYVLSLKNAPAQIEQLRGKYGMFYQWEIHDLEEICPLITNTVQTCVVHGINKENIGRMIVKNNLTGIDRIVPVGHSLDIGVIWDGYDLIRQFTRIVHTF